MRDTDRGVGHKQNVPFDYTNIYNRLEQYDHSKIHVGTHGVNPSCVGQTGILMKHDSEHLAALVTKAYMNGCVSACIYTETCHEAPGMLSLPSREEKGLCIQGYMLVMPWLSHLLFCAGVQALSNRCLQVVKCTSQR